jgi:hypothetical protein
MAGTSRPTALLLVTIADRDDKGRSVSLWTDLG